MQAIHNYMYNTQLHDNVVRYITILVTNFRALTLKNKFWRLDTKSKVRRASGVA